MKANSDYPPDEIQDLGNGSYYKNTNIVTRQEVGMNGETRTVYDYDQELFRYQLPLTIPTEVAAWRLKAIVAIMGLKPAIDSAIATLPEPERTVASLAWYEGTTIRRDSVILASMASGIGVTKDNLDEMFTQAESLSI